MDQAKRSVATPARDGQFAPASHFARYVERAPAPFAVTSGPQHTLVYANPAFRHLLPGPWDDAPGRSLLDAFPKPEADGLQTALDRAFRTGAAAEHRGNYPSGSWLQGRSFSVWPVTHEDGTGGLGVEIMDITQAGSDRDLQRQVSERMLIGALRERGVADDAEAARKRAAFLAQTGRLLAESLDQSSTLMMLTRLALPVLGAWCIVDILADDGTIRRLDIIHPEPEGQKLASQLDGRWVPEQGDPFGAPAMIRSAETLAISDNIELTIQAASNGEENLRILRQLQINSFLTVPLVARGRLLGAVTFVGTRPGMVLSAPDIELAEGLATRGAMALDSAQVYHAALKLKAAAESANRAKTSFLGTMSHELRTPLNAIGGYIELIDMGLRGPVTEAQHADLARVRASQQHLLVLITEILNFVRVGSGRVSYDISDISAHGALARAVELIEPLIARKGLTWDGVAGDSSLMVRADPEKLTQILVNLLSNAIKFTDSGGSLTVNCLASGDTVLLSVADTGIGIPEEKTEAIFEPFLQLKDGLAGREGGVGLGLAISRDLARAMDGDLTVASREGGGAHFTLSLPRAVEPIAVTLPPTD